jgi:hypothetical protein
VSFGPAPTDPAYVTFLAGLKAVAADPTGQASDHWHPLRGNWFSYDPAKWGMEDVQAPSTPPGMALVHFGLGQPSWTVWDSAVPALFTELTSAFARLAAWHPGGNFVWSPWDGSWRIAFERSAPVPPVPAKHNPPIATLPQVAQEKIALIQQMGQRGSINRVLEQAEIQRILDEYV